MLTAITKWQQALTQHTDLDRSTVTQYIGDAQRFIMWFRTDERGTSFADITMQDAKDYRDASIAARRAPARGRTMAVRRASIRRRRKRPWRSRRRRGTASARFVKSWAYRATRITSTHGTDKTRPEVTDRAAEPASCLACWRWRPSDFLMLSSFGRCLHRPRSGGPDEGKRRAGVGEANTAAPGRSPKTEALGEVTDVGEGSRITHAEVLGP